MVERLPDGRVRLVSHAYIPQISDPDMLRIFGSDVSDLVSTIDHNLDLRTIPVKVYCAEIQIRRI